MTGSVADRLARVAAAAGEALRGVGAGTARQGRRLRRHLPGYHGAFVLLYHRIGRPPRDPWGLAVTPEHFAEQLDVLRRHATVMSLAELARARASATLPRDAVAVTFDDGYVDNLREARPLLAAADVPATVFLATGFVGRGGRFWWDEVEHLILGPHRLPPSLRMDASAGAFHRDLPPDVCARRPGDADLGWRVGHGESGGRRALYLEAWAWLARLDGAERTAALEQLREAIGVPDDPDDRDAARALTAAEATELCADGLVEAGAHTVSHPMLTALPVGTQREEIRRSRSDVEALVGRSPTAFSYPHGRYDARTARLVREAGFQIAGTVAPAAGPAECGRGPGDGLHVRRVPVLDWDGDTFLRRLRAGFDA